MQFYLQKFRPKFMKTIVFRNTQVSLQFVQIALICVEWTVTYNEQYNAQIIPGIMGLFSHSPRKFKPRKIESPNLASYQL